MAHIVKGGPLCQKPGCTMSRHRDPILEVVCPNCHAAVGVGCRRPSGHSGPFVEFHTSRDILADREGKYGPCPLGLCGLGCVSPQLGLPLFD